MYSSEKEEEEEEKKGKAVHENGHHHHRVPLSVSCSVHRPSNGTSEVHQSFSDLVYDIDCWNSIDIVVFWNERILF